MCSKASFSTCPLCATNANRRWPWEGLDAQVTQTAPLGAHGCSPSHDDMAEKVRAIEQLKKRRTDACVVVRRMRVPLPQEVRQARKPPVRARQYHARCTRAALLAHRGLGQQGQHNRARKNNLRSSISHMYVAVVSIRSPFRFSRINMPCSFEWFALSRMTWHAKVSTAT
jgi:hypothetical protein